MNDKKAWYVSSQNAEDLSLTIKGFFSVGIISALVMGASVFFGADLNVADLNELLDSFGGVIVAIGAFGSSLVGLYGAGRKVYNKFK